MQVNNVKNIYSTTPGALPSPPCAVGVPEEAPGKRQQHKSARVLDQYRQVRIVTLPTNAGKLERKKRKEKKRQRYCQVRIVTFPTDAGKSEGYPTGKTQRPIRHRQKVKALYTVGHSIL